MTTNIYCHALAVKLITNMHLQALLNLVQQIQESMSVEQKLFDSINQQLAVADKDSAEHKNQSAALCASQARLARLCARNMRCFMQVPASFDCFFPRTQMTTKITRELHNWQQQAESLQHARCTIYANDNCVSTPISLVRSTSGFYELLNKTHLGNCKLIINLVLTLSKLAVAVQEISN